MLGTRDSGSVPLEVVTSVSLLYNARRFAKIAARDVVD